MEKKPSKQAVHTLSLDLIEPSHPRQSVWSPRTYNTLLQTWGTFHLKKKRSFHELPFSSRKVHTVSNTLSQVILPIKKLVSLQSQVVSNVMVTMKTMTTGTKQPMKTKWSHMISKSRRLQPVTKRMTKRTILVPVPRKISWIAEELTASTSLDSTKPYNVLNNNHSLNCHSTTATGQV